MEMPIRVMYYDKNNSTVYKSLDFETYDEFGRWYLTYRLEVGIFSIKGLEKEEEKDAMSWW